jgi:hypothetical protein
MINKYYWSCCRVGKVIKSLFWITNASVSCQESIQLKRMKVHALSLLFAFVQRRFFSRPQHIKLPAPRANRPGSNPPLLLVADVRVHACICLLDYAASLLLSCVEIFFLTHKLPRVLGCVWKENCEIKDF